MATTDTPDTLAHAVRAALLFGVLLSGGLLLCGLGALLLQGDPRPAAPPPSLTEIIGGILHGRPGDYLYGGLLVLMATPLIRVAILGAGWARNRNYLFAGIALGVLALLGGSIWLGVG